MSKPKALCLSCRKYRRYNLRYVPRKVDYQGKRVRYRELRAYCAFCDREVSVEGLWDRNLEAVIKASK